MKIIDASTNTPIESYDPKLGYLTDEKEWAAPECYEAIGKVDPMTGEIKQEIYPEEWEKVFFYIRYTEDDIRIREEAEREAAKQAERERLLLTLSEAFSEELVHSDKQGFLWKVVRLGEVEIMREYVTDPDYDPDGENGSYLKPYKYVDGMEVIESMWYWLDDKELPHECIKSGVPTGFDDTEYFDIVA